MMMMIHGISCGFNLLSRLQKQQHSKHDDLFTNQVKYLQDEDDVFTNQIIPTKYLQQEQFLEDQQQQQKQHQLGKTIKYLQQEQFLEDQQQQQQQQLGKTIKDQHSKLDDDDVFTNQIKYLQQDQLGNVYIPQDVVFIEIISRLPVNCLIQLGRFKPSCSSILFDFILRQLFPYDHDHDHDDDMIFIRAYYPPYITGLSFRDLAPLDCIFIDAFYHPYVGFVDGLVVLSPSPFTADHIFLWNPQTNSFAHTKPCHTPEFDTRKISMASCEFEYYGCGFCPQSKDYKVVRIRSLASDRRKEDFPIAAEEIYTSWDGDCWDIFDEWFETDRFFDANDTILDIDDWDRSNFLDAIDYSYDYGYLQGDYIVDLYSFSTNSWRRVAVDAQLFSSLGGANFYPQRGFTKDTISWLVDEDVVSATYQGLKLLTFHLTSEVFHLTSLPNNVLSDDYWLRVPYPFLFQFFNGTVGMAIPTPNSSSFVIWLLLEYGVMDSWIRLCTIGPFPDVRNFVGVWKNGKVFLESTSGDLLVADLVTNQIIQNLHIKVPEGAADFYLHLKT